MINEIAPRIRASLETRPDMNLHRNARTRSYHVGKYSSQLMRPLSHLCIVACVRHIACRSQLACVEEVLKLKGGRCKR